MQVVLIRKYNDPNIHRVGCRHLANKVVGTICRPIVELTDEMIEHVGYGYIRACKTCKPTGA